MTILPEKLLVRRYGLQADLWGINRELEELMVDIRPLQEERRRLTSSGRLIEGGKGRKFQSLNDALRPLRERMRVLQDIQSRKRSELSHVERSLRITFQAVGHSLALAADKAPAPSEEVRHSDTARGPFRFDLFISHATEDKPEVVEPLVKALVDLGVSVWYDDHQLTIGDSLRQSIDHGLSNSRFGVVVISPYFLRKQWTAYELDSLVAREIESGKVVLPIWHKVTKSEVMKYSPKLGDKFALHTGTATLGDIALELAIAVHRTSRTTSFGAHDHR